MTPISETQHARFYIYKNQKQIRNIYIYYQKDIHFAKSNTICVMF